MGLRDVATEEGGKQQVKGWSKMHCISACYSASPQEPAAREVNSIEYAVQQ